MLLRKTKNFIFVFVYQQVPVTSWFDDMHDTELLTLIPIFERLALVDDVIPALQEIHHRRAIV
jgi:TFIIF-interacting CTD phosphatase-like protein